ncbi:class C sortase [Corynebacterium incognita]|uniref:Class C sortase n=1 Tax=Corynebacterium incognita TaxID=2754725 RepID=A0A7G7CP32_9CORY|nr:class C sortase [Corynebacterium incognita]QNE89348.1 class C sortase [Corynebacterium incognita]
MNSTTTASRPAGASPAAGGQGRKKALLPVLLVVLGMLILLYPVVASQWNNVQQARVAKQYEQQLNHVAPEKRNEAIESARDYNKKHSGIPILDPWLNRLSKDNVDYQAYLKELSGQPAMSQVVIPAINSNLPVYHGTDHGTLQKGVGHLYGSALPVGGSGTHTVLTGHTGLTNATLWDNLNEVNEGDAVYLNTFGEPMKYEVDKIEVVLPEETDSLNPVEGKDLITLITCTPYGVNSHRLLVHGHRVPMDEADHKAFENTSGFVMQWWMWLVLAIVALILLSLLWWLRRNKRKNSQNNQGIEEGDHPDAL